MTRARYLVFVVLVLLMLIMTGCSQKLNGGGHLPSANKSDDKAKATFGFTFDNESGRAKGTYHDHGTGLRIRFDGVIGGGTEPGRDNCLLARFSYVSQDPKQRGDGEVGVYACDNGEPGPTNGDYLEIYIHTGPYIGYHNAGELEGGNLQDLD